MSASAIGAGMPRNQRPSAEQRAITAMENRRPARKYLSVATVARTISRARGVRSAGTIDNRPFSYWRGGEIDADESHEEDAAERVGDGGEGFEHRLQHGTAQRAAAVELTGDEMSQR